MGWWRILVINIRFLLVYLHEDWRLETGSLTMFYISALESGLVREKCLYFLNLFISRLEIISGRLGDSVIVHFVRILNSINLTDLTGFQINSFALSFLFTFFRGRHSDLVILGFV